jgi:linoleoyl-CoA desaturase
MKKIRFQPEPTNGFYNTLRQRVLAYFSDNRIRRYANAKAIVKAITFFSLYISAYIIILRGQLPLLAFLLTWFFMGISIIFIYF